MRVRFEMYKNGIGTGEQCECDLSDKKAQKLFNDLKTKGKCGWAELVGEDDENYMDILDSFDHIRIARAISEIC